MAGLYGETVNTSARKLARGFFKTTLLTQWTSAVQLAAYTTGKRLIRQNTESIYLHNGDEEPVITYSDIEGGWEGEGNIDSDPLFTYPEYGDYTLIETSPCIDTGDPNLWYEDMDGTTGDMGVTGGMFVVPNFISHDFGEVGDNGSAKQLSLYNYRETAITISSVSFNTSSFTTNTSFPITIDPLQSGIINIEVNNSVMGEIEDEMMQEAADEDVTTEATDDLIEQITKRVAARILKSALAKK